MLALFPANPLIITRKNKGELEIHLSYPRSSASVIHLFMLERNRKTGFRIMDERSFIRTSDQTIQPEKAQMEQREPKKDNSEGRGQPEQPSSSPQPASELPVDTGKPYSTFGSTAKRLIISAASLAAFFSPLSSQIYLPSLNVMAKALKVSNSKINLSVTTYMVCFLTITTRRSCQKPGADENLDFTGPCTDHDCRILRARRKTISVLSLLSNLHCRKHRSRFAEKLCGTFGTPLSPECRE